MIKEKKVDIIEVIIQVIFAILATIFIIQILLKLFGSSPTELQLLYIGFGSILSYMFFITCRIGRIDQHLISVDHRLDKIEETLDKFEEKFNKMDERFLKIEKILIKIESKI
ncbi:MAG: hypothetical protein AABY07_06155 [Nanoarchaeota archaeon]